MISHFHISLNVHNLSLPQVSVVLHSTQFNVACRGTCPLIDFSFIFSSLLVSLSLFLLFSLLSSPPCLYSPHSPWPFPFAAHWSTKLWRGLFLTPPLINKSLIPIGQWVSQILFFVELILKPSPERTDVASERGKVTPSYFLYIFLMFWLNAQHYSHRGKKQAGIEEECWSTARTVWFLHGCFFVFVFLSMISVKLGFC